VLQNAGLVSASSPIVDDGLISESGIISAVFAEDPPNLTRNAGVVDAGERYALWGVIDPHVQLYPLPASEHYAVTTAAAVIGGLTTLIQMHRYLNSYPLDESGPRSEHPWPGP